MTKYLNNKTVIAIILTYLSALSLYIFVPYLVHDINLINFKNFSPIIVHDGFYFASYIEKIIFNFQQQNMRLEYMENLGISELSILLNKLSINLNYIYYYLPVIISSLIVVPIILISNTLKGITYIEKISIGSMSSLLVISSFYYYSRTHLGYFDTDMFSLLFPLLIVYFNIKFLTEEKTIDLYISILIFLTSFIFYKQGLYLNYLIYFFTFILSLKSKNRFKTLNKLFVIIYLIYFYKIYYNNIDNFNIYYFFTISAIFTYILFRLIDKYYDKYYILINTMTSIIVLYLIFKKHMMVHLILYKIKFYTDIINEHSNKIVYFFEKTKTLETRSIPFNEYVKNVFDSYYNFILFLISYLYLIYKNNKFILFLPFIILGLLSIKMGIRFIYFIYPIYYISTSYLIFNILFFIKNKYFKIIMVLFFMIFINYNTIERSKEYNLKMINNIYTTLKTKSLNSIDNKNKKQGIIFNWWDPSYELWYYTNNNTIIDGGKNGKDKYIYSKIISSDNQTLSYNLMILVTHRYQELYERIKNKKIKKNKRINNNNFSDLILNNKNPKKYLNYLKKHKLKNDIDIPIYLYFNERMLRFIPMIFSYSNVNYKTGKPIHQRHYYKVFRRYNSNKNEITFGKFKYNRLTKVLINKRTHQKLRLKSHIFVNKNNKNKKHNLIIKTNIDKNGKLYLVHTKDLHKIFLVDDYYYNSLFFQLFILENYDDKLFDLVSKSGFDKIFKLK